MALDEAARAALARSREAAPGLARRLIRAAKEATLATSAGGQPFASLVTPATAGDLSPLLWLSALSPHTRHLADEPRCALLFAGPAPGPNPQTRPRVTVTGLAARVPEGEVPALKARWLARHPYAGLYADLPDFSLWRVTPVEANVVGGFAMAHRLAAAALLPDAAAVAAIAAAEAEIIAHVNDDHPDACDAIATGLLGGTGDGWRMTAVDVDGCDLTRGEEVLRLAFERPVADADGVRRALILAARAARDPRPTTG
jgi:putative heme iron utilization protein